MAFLKVWMNLSGNPLVEGWYRVLKMCLMWFPFMKSLQLCWGELWTIIRDNLLRQSMCSHNFDCFHCGSGLHFYHLWPLRMCIHQHKEHSSLKGPGKSTCTLCHCLDGQGHKWSGATIGTRFTDLHIRQFLATFSRHLSSLVSRTPGCCSWFAPCLVRLKP